ncbi:hypothetical protein AXF42_Ash018180 [Apostasia shenzhenica]|uniref:Uncharacterized protein n=1 Tax=Apostasia shenzhenica TaxID=1088818 RepID=A0A2I0B190_9ASPA|nr:hypothetical protein AXF42_Ash018180 [Apostasia shenzhenica]
MLSKVLSLRVSLPHRRVRSMVPSSEKKLSFGFLVIFSPLAGGGAKTSRQGGQINLSPGDCVGRDRLGVAVRLRWATRAWAVSVAARRREQVGPWASPRQPLCRFGPSASQGELRESRR